MKKLSLFLLTLACVFQFSAQAQERPSYIAIEANSGKLLFSSNAEEKRPVASLSQVATAMVALDWVARTRLPLDTFIAVPQEAFGLRAGEARCPDCQKISARQKLHTMRWNACPDKPWLRLRQ